MLLVLLVRARNAAKARGADKRSELEQVREAAGGAGPDAAQLQVCFESTQLLDVMPISNPDRLR